MEKISYQIKDIFQELQDSEKYIIEENDFKKRPTFEDVITKKTANDPFYYKNQFNSSKTKHSIDTIIPQADLPIPSVITSENIPLRFTRPNITQEYIDNTIPEGTSYFQPPMLSKSYVQEPTGVYSFEKLLLREKFTPPTEDEMLAELVSKCREEQDKLMRYRYDVEYMMEELSVSNIRNKLIFKNYYRNFCHWLFTGEKIDFSNSILKDFVGLPLSGPFDFRSIPNLGFIHDKVIDLSGEDMIKLFKSLDKDITEVEATEVTKRVKEQILEDEEIEKARRETAEEEMEARRKASKESTALLDAARDAGIYKNFLKSLAEEYTLKKFDSYKNTIWDSKLPSELPKTPPPTFQEKLDRSREIVNVCLENEAYIQEAFYNKFLTDYNKATDAIKQLSLKMKKSEIDDFYMEEIGKYKKRMEDFEKEVKRARSNNVDFVYIEKYYTSQRYEGTSERVIKPITLDISIYYSPTKFYIYIKNNKYEELKEETKKVNPNYKEYYIFDVIEETPEGKLIVKSKAIQIKKIMDGIRPIIELIDATPLLAPKIETTTSA